MQLLAIPISVPFSAGLAVFDHRVKDEPRTRDEQRALMAGYAQLAFAGILFAPWIAVGAMLKQRDAFAREQALAFELDRSRLERNALDAKMRLLQAQVEPHFLFNTLANVQALVESGSPQASKVLESLIAYLRAAVPRIHEPSTTLMHELELVRAYLVVMQMRMPDRLEFALRRRSCDDGSGVSADDGADARRKRRATWHRSERDRWSNRCRSRARR